MKLKITLFDMPKFRQRFLDADFHFSNEEIRYQLSDVASKIGRARPTGKYRILNALRKVSGNTDMGVEAMTNAFEASANSDFMAYKITHGDNESTVEMEVQDGLFDLMDEIMKNIPFSFLLYRGKKDFLKKLEKEIRNKFTEKFEIEYG